MMMADDNDKLQASTPVLKSQFSKSRGPHQTAAGRQTRTSPKRPRESDLSSSVPKRASGHGLITPPPAQSTRVAQMKSTVAHRQAGLPACAIGASQLATNMDRQRLESRTARPPPPPPSIPTFQITSRGLSASTTSQRLASSDRGHFSSFPNIAQERNPLLPGIHAPTIRARPNVQSDEATDFAPTAATRLQTSVAISSPLGGIAGPQPNAVANLRSTPAENNSLAELYNEWAVDDWLADDWPANYWPADDWPANHGPANHGPLNHGPLNHGPLNHGPANHGPANHGPANHWHEPTTDAFGTQHDAVDHEAPYGAYRRENDSIPRTSAQNPTTGLAAWSSPAIGSVPGFVGSSDRFVSTESDSTECYSPESASTDSTSITGASSMSKSREMTSGKPASIRGASRKDGPSKGASVARASSRGAQRKDASYGASRSPWLRTLGTEDNVSGSEPVSQSNAASSNAAQRHQSAQASKASKEQDCPPPSLAFSNDEISQIKEYRANSRSWKWIGEKMGITRSRLCEAKNMGLFAEGGVSLAAETTFNDEQISQIKQYRAEGKSWEWIAKDMGTSPKKLRRETEKGLFGDVPVTFSRQRLISDEKISQIKKYCAEGKAWNWIAGEVKISKHTLLRRAAEGLFGMEGKEKSAAPSRLVRLTEDQMRQIKEYRGQKKTWNWIAIQVGVSATTLMVRYREQESGLRDMKTQTK